MNLDCSKDTLIEVLDRPKKVQPLLKKKLILFGAFFMLITLSHAQSTVYFDSLNQARTRLNSGDFSGAFLILDRLDSSFPGEENMIRVKGQAYYWSKDFLKMKAFFRQKISSYPSLEWIKLDFGRMLFELNEFDESSRVLQFFLTDQPDHPEANQMMASITYWKGGAPKKSYHYLAKILNLYPENPSANQLKAEIREATAPYFQAKAEYFSDTQPLNFLKISNSGSTYLNSWNQPGYSLDIRSYDTGTGVFWGQVWNKTTLPNSSTSILIRAGLANSSAWETSAVTYGVKLSQPIGNQLELSGSLDREAYLYTTASLLEQVIPLSYRLEFGREKGNSLTGKVQVHRAEFEDGNWVQNFSIWALYPAVRSSFFRLDLGYAFNASDSKEVRFETNKPITNRQNATSFGQIIPGSYTPYFTPINQQIHAGLAKVQVNLSESIQLMLSANAGFQAQIDNPNRVYYGNPGNGAALIKEDDIFLELYPIKYTPMEFSSELKWRLSSKANFQVQFAYQKTIFFENTTLGAGINLRIWND